MVAMKGVAPQGQLSVLFETSWESRVWCGVSAFKVLMAEAGWRAAVRTGCACSGQPQVWRGGAAPGIGDPSSWRGRPYLSPCVERLFLGGLLLSFT